MADANLKLVECRGVQIAVSRGAIRVSATESIPRVLRIEVDLGGIPMTSGDWNPMGRSFTLIPPEDCADLHRFNVRVLDGTFVLCEYRGGQPYTVIQCGWNKCLACSDSQLKPGHMWVGHNRAGIDEWITCPECRGTSLTPRYKYVDPATGREIDYESQARLAEVPV